MLSNGKLLLLIDQLDEPWTVYDTCEKCDHIFKNAEGIVPCKIMKEQKLKFVEPHFQGDSVPILYI